MIYTHFALNRISIFSFWKKIFFIFLYNFKMHLMRDILNDISQIYKLKQRYDSLTKFDDKICSLEFAIHIEEK